MIALAHDETRETAENEELLTRIIEKYAALGAEVLAARISQKTRPEQALEISSILENPIETSKI